MPVLYYHLKDLHAHTWIWAFIVLSIKSLIQFGSIVDTRSQALVSITEIQLPNGEGQSPETYLGSQMEHPKTSSHHVYNEKQRVYEGISPNWYFFREWLQENHKKSFYNQFHTPSRRWFQFSRELPKSLFPYLLSLRARHKWVHKGSRQINIKLNLWDQQSIFTG